MFLHLDTTDLVIALAVIAAFGYLFGAVLDAILRESGFGPTGNTLLFIAGFFIAVLVANRHGIAVDDLRLATACGLGGAFAFISAVALLKAGLSRL